MKAVMFDVVTDVKSDKPEFCNDTRISDLQFQVGQLINSFLTSWSCLDLSCHHLVPCLLVVFSVDCSYLSFEVDTVWGMYMS